MEAWDADGNIADDNIADRNIMVGKRRRRAKRRRAERRPGIWLAGTLSILLTAGVVAGGYWWLTRPSGLAALPDPAVDAPGGFRASVSDDGETITVGMEIHNATEEPITIAAARVVAPTGLRQTALTVVTAGKDNEGFTLTGELPEFSPLVLGIGDEERDAVLAARFAVDCPALLASAAATDERIFVTIQVGSGSNIEERDEELVAPVVGVGDEDVSWLTGTARRACADGAGTAAGADAPSEPLPAS